MRRLRCALTIALLALAPVATQSTSSERRASAEFLETRNEAVVRAAFARWAAGGTRFLDEILTPDMRQTIFGSGPSAGPIDAASAVGRIS